MNKRQKALKVMAEQAGLTPVAFDVRNSRNYLRCEADNGNQAEFWLACVTTLDPRAEQNELSRMKRFARENAVVTPTSTTTQPEKENKTMKSTSAAAVAAPAPAAPKQPPQAAIMDLSAIEFLRLSMWLNNQDLAAYASMDALVLEAGKHMDRAVEENTIRSALHELKRDEPSRWSEPTDPHAILARELARLMDSLGMAPTGAFTKLVARLSV